jgi:hypothetical protein
MTASDDLTRPGENEARQTLEQGLASLAQAAADLGANTLAVLVLESESVEVAYRRTESGELLSTPASILCGLPIRRDLESAPSVTADNPAAKFLTSVVNPQAHSFLLFPWRARPAGVTIVFGFESREPACASIPAALRESIGMASLAAWSLNEVSRLREELRRANLSLAARKCVERAKGILQSERGMSERQAYEFLRRTSRQRRIPLLKVAEALCGSARCP